MKLIKTKSFELATITSGNENSKKLALVLPGRLDTKDYICFTEHINYLSEKGYYALSFDPPGTWESHGDIKLFTTTNYIKAVNELIEYFENKPTFILGHSRGGAVAIIAGMNNPKVIAIASIMASFGNPTPPNPKTLKTGYITSYRDLPPGNVKSAIQTEFNLPLNYFTDGEIYNAATTLNINEKSRLIFYGTDDEFTKPEQAQEVYNSLSGPKMIHKLKTTHDYRYNREIVVEINNTIGTFLSKFDL